MLSLALIILATIRATYAWGVLGHETVAYIAQNFVKDTTATWAQNILSDTSSSYLANVATWADSYRATTAGKWSAPFHFIDANDNPPSSCAVDYARDCGSAGCSVSAIANYTQRVGDGRLSADNTAQAMKFLVHFLGDITQPLHDEAYEVGGNDIQVTFDGHSSDNLHSIWDTYMPQTLIGSSALSDAQSWAITLTAQIESGSYASQASSWIAGDDHTKAVATATRWATDANTFVCSKVMPNGASVLQQGDLYPTYYNSVIDTIELQIAKGGYRLANWLNQIADAELKHKRAEAGVDAEEFEKRDVVVDSAAVERELDGVTFLPVERDELTRAQLARRALGWGCGHEH